MVKKRDHDGDDEQQRERELREYARKLQFAMHQLAMKSTERTEEEFEADLATMGVWPGMPEFEEAKRAWIRFQRKGVRSV
jgi:hypothetical protein